MESERALRFLQDDELLRRLGELVSRSRRVEADLVAHIGEADARKLYAREASSSMFCYCTEVLHLSEAEAYLRITVARAAREHPVLLTMLGDGRLQLSGIARLAPLLTRDNRDALLERATHKSKRQILELVAGLSPRPDAPSLMRQLPQGHRAPRRAASAVLSRARAEGLELCPDRVVASSAAVSSPSASAPMSRAVVEPLSPARYKVQFTASAELHDKLERLEARRYAKTSAPRQRLGEPDTSPALRQIPAAVRRAVHERDGGRCRFVDGQGRRCTARERLEFHRRHPFAHGGDRSPKNICLMCRTHNQYLAEHDYGTHAVARHRGLGTVSGAVRRSGPP